MKLFPLLATFVFVAVPLSGCMDFLGGDEDDYVPRTHEITLEVKAATSTTIPLYTLNDGTSQMNVVAMGFTYPDQETLTVPNPEIRIKEGDSLIVHILNNNPLPHTFHVHGGIVPWEMDGVPFLNQMPIMQGEEFTYVFENMKAGSYMYHCHVDAAHHIDLGMYGAFIVEERQPKHKFDREYVMLLDEWDNCHVHGNLDPVTNAENNAAVFERDECLERFVQDNIGQNQAANSLIGPVCAQNPPEPIYSQLQCESHSRTPPGTDERAWYPTTFPVYAPEYNTYLINGKSFPDTTPMPVREGETVKLRMMNIGEQLHTMHLHGHSMLVTHRDGYALEHTFRVDTLGIMPGERYDVVVKMDNPGLWAFHDHVGLNVMNDHISPGGMFTCIAYQDFKGVDAFGMDRAVECIEEAMVIHGGHGH